jgi:hypothetical protein
MSKVIRFRFAMLLCYTSHFIFPKCNFKKDLEEIMFKQARHFGTQNRLFGTTLKELLKEESK